MKVVVKFGNLKIKVHLNYLNHLEMENLYGHHSLTYSMVLLPLILLFANEPNTIIMIACVAILFNVLLEILSQMHFRHHTGNETVHILFKYTLMGLTPHFALVTIMLGVFS